MKRDLSIYIHWPWCLKKCPYCDFNSHVADDSLHEAYISALITDLNHQKTLTGDRSIVSIFFGGGTPSLMKPVYIQRILAHIDIIYCLLPDTEITMEANPTSSNKQKFNDFKSSGINRLSIGVQSFDNKDLKFLGREHDSKNAMDTISDATKVFSNVSFDLIYGLPDQTLENWENQISRAIDFNTQHLSAYQLTIEKNTKFYSDVKKNKWTPMGDDLQADFFEFTRDYMTAHNFNHYEISNFSRESYNCQHNLNIWKYQDYIGVGAGAHGRLQTLDKKRISTQNYRMPKAYIDTVERVKHGFYAQEDLNEHSAWQETLLMGLRIQQGVHQHLLERDNRVKQALNKYLTLGMLHKNHEKIALTDIGQLHLDTILEEILFE
jgi:putative oxygen-independent coproporphyrinogen III oxidase